MTTSPKGVRFDEDSLWVSRLRRLNDCGTLAWFPRLLEATPEQREPVEFSKGGLFLQAGLEDALPFELRHQEIIERFGHYPHRNAILGRVSSAEELAFLNEPGSSF